MVKFTSWSNHLKEVILPRLLFLQTNLRFSSDSLNLKIPNGSLVAIVGSVGSGKTSILSALLGEMNKTSGQVDISGTMAYVPQTAWIFNATLKENILFGRDYNEKLYEQIVEACALKPDFGMRKKLNWDKQDDLL